MIDKSAAVNAIQRIFSQVYLPTFLAKLAADYDVRPQTPEDVSNLLQMAALLSTTRPQRAAVKQAEAANSPVSVFLRDATQNLSTALTGISSTDVQAEAVKAGALAQLARDPEMQEAAAIYGVLAAQAR